MMSLKETKRMSGIEAETLTLTAAPAIHMGGSIVNPGSNETISIVIPMSSQLSKMSGGRPTVDRPCKGCDKEEKNTEQQLHLESQQSRSQHIHQALSVPISHVLSQQTVSLVQQVKGKPVVAPGNQFRADKTKGCPFPTCSRYGRAFSRAHDLKRHIARHDTRKEKPVETNRSNKLPTCGQCGENFLNEAILQRHARLHIKSGETVEALGFSPPALALAQAAGLDPLETAPRTLVCNFCKKKCTSQSKLKAHLSTHEKKSERNVCTLCGCEFDQEGKLQVHMREHTSSILQAQEALNKATDKSTQVKEEDDDFMLEEMLLLNKNPRIHAPGAGVSSTSTSTSCSSSRSSNNNNKIRCEYCSKTFKTKWTLSSHVAAHEGRFQFGCTRCGKKFVRKSHFEGHVRSHEAARPYVCEQCGKTFKELKHRREHTKRKHPGNQNAIQNLLDSISACVSEDSSVDQTKFTLLMPINFGA